MQNPLGGAWTDGDAAARGRLGERPRNELGRSRWPSIASATRERRRRFKETALPWKPEMGRAKGGLVKLIDAQPRQPHRLGALEDYFGLRATRRISLGPGLLSRER